MASRKVALVGSLRRATLNVAAALVVVYLSAAALRPSIVEALPENLRWFGAPGSVWTTVIAVTVLIAACATTLRFKNTQRLAGVSFTVIALLGGASALLGLCSYWRCHDADHPAFITPLMATAQLVKGGIGDYLLGSGVCPPLPSPAALEVARIAALSAILTAVSSIVLTVFHTQTDRLRASLANSVTAIVGMDVDAESMIGVIAQTMDRRSTLVAITAAGQSQTDRLRRQGARIVLVDFNDPSTLLSLKLWRNLKQLYLIAPDSVANLSRLQLITRRLTELGHEQRPPLATRVEVPALVKAWRALRDNLPGLDRISRRIPGLGRKQRTQLTVRIDDPWLARAWRAQQFGRSDTRWAAAVVGKYETTADRLLDRIVASTAVTRVFVCGASQLTSALCADLTRRTLERDFHAPAGATGLPALTLVDRDALDYVADNELHRQQTGLVFNGPQIDVVAEDPTLPTILRLIGADSATSVVIMVTDVAASVAARLAARFPDMPVYAPDFDDQTVGEPVRAVGMLHYYSLTLTPREDVWERAARLIHERYVATRDPARPPSPAAVPWGELSDFYRVSNRRTVRNALWMVEQIGGHSWNTWGSPPSALSSTEMADLSPLEQLALLGFDYHSATRMARAEHESWCRYYRANGWTHGAERDERRKIHDKLVGWSVVKEQPDLLDTALRSVATTLWSLRQLGYRSRPLWRSFARTGTVVADKQAKPWTWQSDSGNLMRAEAGSWAVREGGKTWSVRDDIFRATYEPAAAGGWRRKGHVQARPAFPGETIDTLEGPTIAADGDWVVRGADGEQWPIPGEQFARSYAELDESEQPSAGP